MPHTITAHIVVRDPQAAAEWYTAVFGAQERSRIPLPGVMIADEFPDMGIVSPKTLGGTYGALVILTDDVDAMWQRALAAGAEVFHPLADTFWGERSGQVIDPYGHRWGFTQHIRDVPREEVIKAAAEAFGDRSSPA